MILYNNNDQQITLPGVRVGTTLVPNAALTVSLNNITTLAQVFSTIMTPDPLNVGNYLAQPPIFNVPTGTNYQLVFSGLASGFEMTLVQAAEVQNRTH